MIKASQAIRELQTQSQILTSLSYKKRLPQWLRGKVIKYKTLTHHLAPPYQLMTNVALIPTNLKLITISTF
jgi:hypothetical protein